MTQKKRCEAGYTGQNWATCIVREGWLTFNLPEFSSQPIAWHGNLNLMVLNIYRGQLYLVGIPMHLSDYRFYGEPEPFYVGLVWKEDAWNRISFSEIPKEIYETNIIIATTSLPGVESISLLEKNGPRFNGRIDYPSYHKRIDPNYRSNFPPVYHASDRKSDQ